MTEQVVTYEFVDSIAIIGLNRPEKRNALNEAMASQLSEAAIRANEEAKVAILFGHGLHFSGGLDLAMLARQLPEGQPRRRPRLSGIDLIARGEIPFIAALSGAVVGWGLEIAACAHIRVADKSTYFSLPEGQRGIFLGGGGSVRLSRLLGVACMTDMMLTGRVLSAEEAERFNAIQYVVERGQALLKARELADCIARNSPLSNHAIINGLPRLRDLPYDEGLYFERLVAGTTFGPDAMERVNAFVEKRAEPLKVPSVRIRGEDKKSS